MKLCGKCKRELPYDEFWKNKNTSDGYQAYCKSCMKIKSAEYREEKINGDRVRMNNRQLFLDSLKTPCVKCGEKRPWVIQFHHKDNSEKLFTIGEGAKYHKSKNDVIAEVKKCVCLCANCHKEFHYLYGINPKNPVEKLEHYLREKNTNV